MGGAEPVEGQERILDRILDLNRILDIRSALSLRRTTLRRNGRPGAARGRAPPSCAACISRAHSSSRVSGWPCGINPYLKEAP